MIRSWITSTLSLAGLALLLYGACFVPLGERTLADHILRIAATDEAKDLGADVSTAGTRISDEVRSRLPSGASPDAPANVDGGQPPP